MGNKNKLTKVLLKVLEQLSKENNWKEYGIINANGLLNFIPYFQFHLKKQNVNVLAKDIVRALGAIRYQPEVSQKIKRIIEEIFLHMDARDLKWLTGECDCPRCRGDKKGMMKELKDVMEKMSQKDTSKDATELPYIGPEIKA